MGDRALRGLRPVRGPHVGQAGHLLRRPYDHPRVGRRPVLSRAASGARRRRTRAGHHRARAGNGGGDPGPAFLHESGEQVVQRHGLGRHQHDRLPRGLSGPRTRAVLRQHLPGDRFRCRPGGRSHRSSGEPPRGGQCFQREQRAPARAVVRGHPSRWRRTPAATAAARSPGPAAVRACAAGGRPASGSAQRRGPRSAFGELDYQGVAVAAHDRLLDVRENG